MNSYYDGLNQKLLHAIPTNARKILELGCANGRLGQRYKELNRNSRWIGIDIAKSAVAEASQVLDEAHQVDIDVLELSNLGSGFDVIVIGDLLEHLKSPEYVLDKLYNLSSPNAVLVCCIPNMAHLSVIERMICGDISYDDMGLLDRTHTRFFSTSSAIKMFLDSGWLPDICDQYDSPPRNSEFLNSVISAASALGVPKQTALGQLSLYQMIARCQKWDMAILKEQGPMAPFSVIVPVNRPWQYDLNILRSPGLKEVNAEIIPVLNANSAADAYQTGAAKAKNDWKIIAHQDVYFPSGSGLAIARHFGNLSAKGATANAVGFAGLEERTDGSTVMTGMLIDRKRLFKHPTSEAACSIDEFAVALHSEAQVKIDPRLGWHMWGTDLCLQSEQKFSKHSSRVVDIPLFHNSTNDYALPSEFDRSVETIFMKYKNLYFVNTLCGKFSNQIYGRSSDHSSNREEMINRIS
jgi:2-polyprenyl-3-methyl-5-hydroxy-6-metoxy-1,4-benzoquinol methylase